MLHGFVEWGGVIVAGAGLGLTIARTASRTQKRWGWFLMIAGVAIIIGSIWVN
ncbi:MAG: hypothetical protein V4480_05050 [Patescibacteria group bacterium]